VAGLFKNGRRFGGLISLDFVPDSNAKLGMAVTGAAFLIEAFIGKTLTAMTPPPGNTGAGLRGDVETSTPYVSYNT